MGDLKCRDRYCQNGYVFIGEVDSDGVIKCSQVLAKDTNNNCHVDTIENNLLTEAFRENRIGAVSFAGVTLGYYLEYLSHLDSGAAAVKSGSMQKAREEAVLAREFGKAAGLDPYYMDIGISHMIILQNQNNEECYYTCLVRQRDALIDRAALWVAALIWGRDSCIC